MIRLQPQVFSRIKVLNVCEGIVYYAKGNSVYRTTDAFQDHLFLGKFNTGVLFNFLARFRWTARLGRLGFHALYTYRDTLIGIQRGHIVMLDKDTRQFVSVFSDFRGSRPLLLLITPQGDIYFGEYFGNDNREEVHIYKSVNGKDWSKVYSFQAGAIRHVHGLFWDPFKQGIWVLTGDSDEESGLWFTSDDFNTLTKFSDKSQRSRAVEMIPVTRDELLVPMDTPLATNYVNIFDVTSQSFTPVLELESSAFHIMECSGVICLSTVTEPSEVNKTKKAHIYVSSDGRHWIKLASLQKDFIPVSKQKYFGYAEISFSRSSGTADYIYAHAKAVRGYDGKTLRWKITDIKEMLRDEVNR